MAPTILYTVTLLGAAGLYLLVRPSSRPWKAVGMVLGLGALGWLLAALGDVIGEAGRPSTAFLIFSVIAVASGVRMITHSRPVYAALYFILVVLSSAGLFLLLAAEFMAFALVIVYAGAILVTYVFVLMLAQQASDPDHPSEAAIYDRTPREPAAGAAVGFILLAVLASVLFGVQIGPAAESAVAVPATTELRHPTEAVARRAAWHDLQRMPRQLEATVLRLEPAFRWPAEAVPDLHVRPDGTAYVRGHIGDDEALVDVELPLEADPVTGQRSAMPENLQRVGMSLVADFPASLELAGVILLMAMFGAVVLARRQIELGEDELRAAVGLRRVSHHEDYELVEPESDDGGEPA